MSDIVASSVQVIVIHDILSYSSLRSANSWRLCSQDIHSPQGITPTHVYVALVLHGSDLSQKCSLDINVNQHAIFCHMLELL